MELQQLDATVRQHHADPQAKSQPGAVTGNRYPDMIAVIVDHSLSLPLQQNVYCGMHMVPREIRKDITVRRCDVEVFPSFP